MTELSLFYLTCPSETDAQDIAHRLLEKKLIACANILPQMTSIYRWEGKVEQESEVIVLLKSRSELAPQIESEILEAHPYECPCLLELPVTSGYEGFLNWVDEQIPHSY
jgi:periplasmic divalent cation tolerance protein